MEKKIMQGDWVKKVYDDFVDDPFGSSPYSIDRMRNLVRNFMSMLNKTVFNSEGEAQQVLMTMTVCVP